MLDTERATLRTFAGAPWLVVGGFVVGVAALLASLVAAAPVMSVLLPHEARPPLALALGSVVSVLVVPPALSGLYVVARRSGERDDRPGPLETVRLYVGGCLRHARDLTAATVVYRVAALAPAAVAFVLLLSADTAVNYWQYAQGAPGSTAPWRS